MSEYSDPLMHVDIEMARKARDYLSAVDMIPDFQKIEQSPDARFGLLRYIHRQLKEMGGSLHDTLDSSFAHATIETVLAFPTKEGDDMFAIQHEQLVMQHETALPLWPIFLLEEEKTEPFNFAYIDRRGRIFEIGNHRLIEPLHPGQQLLPVEVPMQKMPVREALAFHQAAEETFRAIEQLRK